MNYYFITAAEFADLVARDRLLEWAEFAGNHYGTPRDPVEARLAAGQDVLLEIEVQGARQVRRAPGLGADAVLIFLAPPVVRRTGPPAGRPRHRGRQHQGRPAGRRAGRAGRRARVRPHAS